MKKQTTIIIETLINFYMKAYLLKNEEILELGAKIPGWKISKDHIHRCFTFSNFIEAFSFMTKVAFLSEKYNHHPNWDNVYSKVNIKFTTHDLGGISNLDQIIACEINNLLDN